jgi:hypothetical protein
LIYPATGTNRTNAVAGHSLSIKIIWAKCGLLFCSWLENFAFLEISSYGYAFLEISSYGYGAKLAGREQQESPKWLIEVS